VANAHLVSVKSPSIPFFLTVHVLVLFYAFRPRGQLMLSAVVVGTSFILSIGVLMAHAIDAFRNRLPQKISERRGWLAPRQAARLSWVFCIMGQRQ
jgi:hypothetical protein